MAHLHPVIDADIHFEIDAVTRSVKNVSETKTMLVQFDHNSERFTFKVPRYVDGHDLRDCNRVRVHYINIEKSKRTQNSGIYEVTDLDVCPEDEQFVTCSWLVPDNATQLVGSLHFVIQFACEEDGNLLYSWNTAKHTSVTVTDGIDCGDSVIRENESILTQWKAQLEANQITKVEQTTVSTEDNGENIWTVTFGDGRTQDLTIKNGSKGSTGYVGSIETLNGDILHFYVGSKDGYEEFKALEEDSNVIAFFTDDDTMEQVVSVMETVAGILDGTVQVPNETVAGILDGTVQVQNAKYATSLTSVYTPYTATKEDAGYHFYPNIKENKIYVMSFRFLSQTYSQTVVLASWVNAYMSSTTSNSGNFVLGSSSGGFVIYGADSDDLLINNKVYVREL